MKEQELLKMMASVLDTNVEESVYLNDNGTEFKVDLKVQDGVLDLHVEKKKDEFKEWVKTLDDELFQDALERTVAAFNVDTISEIKDQKELEEVFKNMVSKIATEKIEQLKSYV